MAVLNVLDYVQRGLSIADSDNVSSITEGVEAAQVFILLKTAYHELLNAFPWKHLQEFMNLQVTAVANEMKLPTDAVGFSWIRYNKKDVTYIEPLEMQRRLDSRETDNVDVDPNGALNDRDPVSWTTVDDDTIIFDSYDGSLQSSLSVIEAIRKNKILISDTDFPDIPERMESTLLNMVLAESLRVLKADETRALIYDEKAMDGLAALKRWARRFNRVDSWYGRDYGRRGGGRGGITVLNQERRINDAGTP